jgi:hypothetical protein
VNGLVLLAVAFVLVFSPAVSAQGGLRSPATTSTTVTLNWTAPGDDSTSGQAAAYDVRYSLSTITAANWASATQVTGEPTPKAAGGVEAYDVSGLTPNTMYYFALKTSDEAGNWSALSNIISKSTLQETTAPSAIANLAAPSSTAASVSLTWTSPGDDGASGTATTYDIRYSTSTITAGNWASATQVTGETAPKIAGSSESFTVSGLNPSTTYYFAIETADEVPNWSSLSNVVGKATLSESVAPSAIANLAAPTSTASSVSLTWTAPGDDGGTGTATTYDVRYSTSAITAGNWASATQATGEPSPKAAGGSESFTISGLNSTTTYYFAVETADEVPNWSSISNVVSKATASETTPPAAITNLGASNETSTSVTLSWTSPGDDGSSGTATTYDIRYSTSTITAANFASATVVSGAPTPKVAGSAETFVVTGLATNTGYYFAVKTADEVPNGSTISNVVNRSTQFETTPPSAIADLAAPSSGQNSITLTWTAPGDDTTSGTATSYDIRYSTSPITAGNWAAAIQLSGEPSPKASGGSESLTITGLAMSTTYYFAIKTGDEVPNWSAISNVVSKATTGDITAPAAVQDLSALPGSADGDLVLRWTAPGDDSASGIASIYVIRYSTSAITNGNFNSATLVMNPPVPLVAGSSQSLLMRNLVPGQRYYVALKTLDDKSNTSGLSNVAQGSAKLIIVTDNNDKIADLVSPPPNAVVPSAHPMLVVRAINPGQTDNYVFEVASDSSFVGLIASAVVSDSDDSLVTWRVSTSLSENQSYYWRAHAEGFGYSATGSFDVSPRAHPFPNPYYPSTALAATFTDLPAGSELVLVSVSGEPIRRWSALTGADVNWDGTNEAGNAVSSGTYLWYVSNGEMSGKLIVIR